jgi:ABC-type Zn uptake system ZnuABC Zn-binding protein ZnuA
LENIRKHLENIQENNCTTYKKHLENIRKHLENIQENTCTTYKKTLEKHKKTLGKHTRKHLHNI